MDVKDLGITCYGTSKKLFADLAKENRSKRRSLPIENGSFVMPLNSLSLKFFLMSMVLFSEEFVLENYKEFGCS